MLALVREDALFIVQGIATPVQSTSPYEAIRSSGGTTWLVLMPNEQQWYVATEPNRATKIGDAAV